MVTLSAFPLHGLAAVLPQLRDTALFAQVVQDCSPLTGQTWRHPTKAVLAKHKVEIDQVQLCNGGTSPIFYVRLPYDPQGKTASYFGPLYKKMRAANGGWPFAFVAVSDNTVVYVRYRADGVAEGDYEMYTP